jgi:hypothetical protein
MGYPSSPAFQKFGNDPEGEPAENLHDINDDT